jgi:ABC-2 type transport system ATP-binding protein
MGFLGPNGAGKSTTMNIICGCISANEGSASVCGHNVLENPKAVKQNIGYLPENPPLYFDMTVIEYLEFVYELKKIKDDKQWHLETIMERVKLSHMKNRMIKNLSKGYKQRVGLAQALIGDPQVLILDEPTVGLDPKQIVEIRNLIKEIGKQRTIILSTHILQEVEAICDSVTIISHGKIVAQDSIEGLEETFGGKDKYILSIIGDMQSAKDAIEAIPAVKTVEIISEEECTAQFVVEKEPESEIRYDLTKKLAEKGIAIAQLRPASLTLEEIFIKLTNDKCEEQFEEEAVQEENPDEKE